ncbi:PAP2 superfamily protein [uncultured archaeon]|nr:PAP2 superfamily protein [uncultured archaeon]
MKKILLQKFFEEITFFGGIAFYFFIILLFFIFNEYILSFKLFLGLMIIYLITFFIRLFYFKERPKKIEHNNFLERIDASSFPSVHAARITFLFLFFLFYSFFSLSLIAKILMGGIFLFTLYSRIYLSKHDAVDIIAGVILGGLAMIIFFI